MTHGCFSGRVGKFTGKAHSVAMSDGEGAQATHLKGVLKPFLLPSLSKSLLLTSTVKMDYIALVYLFRYSPEGLLKSVHSPCGFEGKENLEIS